MTSTVVVNPAAALMYEEVKCHMPEEPKAEVHIASYYSEMPSV